MSWPWLVAGIVAGGVAIIFGGELLRLGKTLYLIARITPYEQSGIGEPRILIIGDSTGYGTGARHARNSIAGRIGSSFPDAMIENQSKNGWRLDELAGSLETMIGNGQYDLIVMQMGANDILAKRPIEEVMNDLKRIYATLASHTQHIVFLTAGNVGGASAFSDTQKALTYERLSLEYYKNFNDLATEHDKLTFVDLFTPRESDPFVLHPELYLATDGLHPSDAGYGLWYEKVFPHIDEVLSR